MTEPNSTTSIYDLIIVGAGMVGASLAAALSELNINALLIDKKMNCYDQQAEIPELRISSISQGSVDWLAQQGIWPHLAQQRIQYYQQLSVAESAKSHCHFDARSLHIDALGCFVENSNLQNAALLQNKFPVVEADIESCWFADELWNLNLSNHTQLKSKLVIAADGARSQIRQLGGFSQQGWQYPQACYSASVKLKHPVEMNHTWQRFEQGNAIAFLPLYQNFASLIVYQKPRHIKQLNKASRAEQIQQLKHLFNAHIGEFELIDSASFPLQKMSVLNPVNQGMILVGDAAHTIHPLAGQGVNVGIRDIALLTHLIQQFQTDLAQLQNNTHWRSYKIKRNLDVQTMSAAMDMVFYSFNQKNPLVSWLRNQALSSVEHITPLKQLILKLALGEIKA
ncbi:FAD-dependent monooxygenase [Catenovulum adriaticum]|uniref:FAD-dependent monooxygenase n=1 Tax=Catenovulum adriaticum TaxID=2984846 RepID=A0ABY7APJ0_9ALTE|nr:FAD-dependent monooxygenase [Catenovulum sp. TS8]WAJ70576.1 FAD-dependent monooxygenase [Catenovulum sp. TS8]